MAKKIAKPTAKAKDAKVMAGIDKHLTNVEVTLSGQSYKAADLKAVYQADSDAIDATDSAHATWQQKVADERATHAKTAAFTRKLRSFLLAYFGEEAVAILSDFSLTAPKSTATATVATKALAQAKAKATRIARGTTGSVKKKATVGTLTSVVLSATPAGATMEPSTPAGTSPAASTPAATSGDPGSGGAGQAGAAVLVGTRQ